MLLTNYSTNYYTCKFLEKQNKRIVVHYQQMLDVHLREINCNCIHILLQASYFVILYYLYIIHNIISTP